MTTSTSYLVKIAEALTQGWSPLNKWYHPEAREHFKRKLEKGKDEALEHLYETNARKPPAHTKW